jgi:hypothetical protein
MLGRMLTRSSEMLIRRAFFAAFFLLAVPGVARAQSGAWSPSGALGEARFRYSGATLADGHVLVAGGLGHGATLASAELYDPDSGAWVQTGSMIIARSRHTLTPLADGRVLVTGGRRTNAGGSLASAEIFDPMTGQWTATAAMTTPRDQHAAALLADGRVLITGGINVGETGQGEIWQRSAEIFDPATGQFTATDNLQVARKGHTMTLLGDGRVLVSPGSIAAGDCSFTPISELYDPVAGRFTDHAQSGVARSNYAATLLPDGRVLVVGGFAARGPSCGTPTNTVEIYDPVGNRWSSVGALAVARANMRAVVLANGKVLVPGGLGATGPLASAELFDATTNLWSAAASLGAARATPAFGLLDGQVLVAGGSGVAGPLASSEIFTP